MGESGKDERKETKLVTWRKRRGLTQEDMVRATGISRSTYRRLEQGDYENPGLRYLMNCAITLGCDLDDLIEDRWREWYQRFAAAPPDPSALWRTDA